MIKKYSGSFRKLDDSEFYFISKEAMEFVQLSIELETPSEMMNYLNQLKRSVSGLYTRCDGRNLYSIDRKPSDIQVHRIPPGIKTLKSVNEWMYEHHTPDISVQMAEIGSDEHRIVINSSHICSDGCYITSLINGIQTKKGLKNHPILPCSIIHFLRDEFSKVENRTDIKISGYDKVTRLHIQKVDPTVPELSKANFFTGSEKAKNLACYDKNKEKTNGLTENLWCALSLAFCALNEELGPIGISTCVDFRRFIFPQTRISNSMTNFFGCINIAADQINGQSLRVSDVLSQFRNNFNYIVNNDALFYNYIHPIEMNINKGPIAHLSNIGPIKYKHPIKDFEISLKLNQKAQQQSAQVMSYSKLKTDETGEKVLNNIIHYQFTYSPAVINHTNGRKIFESFKYFMNNIKPSMLLVDAFNEIKTYMKKIT